MTKQDKLLAYLAEKYPEGFTSINLNDDPVVILEIGYGKRGDIHTVLYRLKRSGKISATGGWGAYVYKLVAKVSGKVVALEGKVEKGHEEEKRNDAVGQVVPGEAGKDVEVLESVELQRLDQAESVDSALVMKRSVEEEEERDEEIRVDLKLFLTPKERRVYDQLLMLSKAVLGKEERRFNVGQLEQFHDGEREDFLQKLEDAGVIVKTGNDSDTVPGFPCYRIVEKFYLGLINRIEIVLPKLGDQVAVLANELAVQKIEIDEIKKRENVFLARYIDSAGEQRQLLSEKELLDERLRVVNGKLESIKVGLKNDKSVAEELGEKRRVLSLEFSKKSELHSCLAKIDALPEAEQALLRSLLTGE